MFYDDRNESKQNILCDAIYLKLLCFYYLSHISCCFFQCEAYNYYADLYRNSDNYNIMDECELFHYLLKK